MPSPAGVSAAERIMLESLKNFIASLAGEDTRPERFAETDYRLAAAALLIHVTMIDGEMSEAERSTLHRVLQQRFNLSDSDTAELIDEATDADRDAVDLYHFTRLINRSLDEDGRRRIVEMMWEITFADGSANEFEDNIVWRAADLLGISSRERIELKRRVGGSDGGEA